MELISRMMTVTLFLPMKTESDLMGECYSRSYYNYYQCYCRAEGEDPVLPGSVSSVKSDDDEDDQYDEDQDEQCKYIMTLVTLMMM